MYKTAKDSVKTKDCLATFRLKADYRRQLEAIAAKSNVTLTHVVHQLIRDAYNAMEQTVEADKQDKARQRKYDQTIDAIFAELTSINIKLGLNNQVIDKRFTLAQQEKLTTDIEQLDLPKIDDTLRTKMVNKKADNKAIFTKNLASNNITNTTKDTNPAKNSTLLQDIQ